MFVLWIHKVYFVVVKNGNKAFLYTNIFILSLKRCELSKILLLELKIILILDAVIDCERKLLTLPLTPYLIIGAEDPSEDKPWNIKP